MHYFLVHRRGFNRGFNCICVLLFTGISRI
jgi:hypothetical protein